MSRNLTIALPILRAPFAAYLATNGWYDELTSTGELV